MNSVPSEIVNKVFLGEVTLGEVWEFVKDRVHHVVVVESEFKWGPYEHISFVPGVRLEVSSVKREEYEDFEPDYSFDLGSKVVVKGDYLELDYEDAKGVELHFMYQPDPESIKLDFLFSGD